MIYHSGEFFPEIRKPVQEAQVRQGSLKMAPHEYLVKYRSDSTRSIGVPRTAIFDLFFEFPRLRNGRAHNDHWKDTTEFFTA